MTDLRDLRVRISPTADQVLAGVAHARNCDKQELVRQILDDWAEKVLHECNIIQRFTRGEGTEGSARE